MAVRLILGFFAAMLPYMLVALPLILAFRTYWLRHRKLRPNLWHEAALLIFLVLLVGLASQSILPRFELTEAGWRLKPTGWGGLNLIPLAIFRDSVAQARLHNNLVYFFINFCGNIGVFLPLGFFPPLLWQRFTLKHTLLLGFLASLLIELCQLPQYRGTDIDDLWLNTLGAACGYWLFIGLRKCFPRFCARFQQSAD